MNECPQRVTKFICSFRKCHGVCSNNWEVSFVMTLLILMPLTRKCFGWIHLWTSCSLSYFIHFKFINVELANVIILFSNATFVTWYFCFPRKVCNLIPLFSQKHSKEDMGCLPFVRVNQLGRALNNGKSFSKISKPTERNGAYHLHFDFP